MKKTFTRKGYGRIYVRKQNEISIVKEEIKKIDEFEFEYLPDYFITTFSNYPYLKYTHKFDDIDINKLTAKCWKKGVFIFCLDNGNDEFI